MQMQALKDAGVTEVVLAINYRPEVRFPAQPSQPLKLVVCLVGIKHIL
jgi:hypothetical protein